MSRPLPWFVASGKKIVGIGRNFADHAKELVLDIAVRMMECRGECILECRRRNAAKWKCPQDSVKWENVLCITESLGQFHFVAYRLLQDSLIKIPLWFLRRLIIQSPRGYGGKISESAARVF